MPGTGAERTQRQTNGKEPKVRSNGASSSCRGAAFLARGGAREVVVRFVSVFMCIERSSCLAACVRVFVRASAVSSAETHTHADTGGSARKCSTTVDRQTSIPLSAGIQHHPPPLAGHEFNKVIKTLGRLNVFEF